MQEITDGNNKNIKYKFLKFKNLYLVLMFCFFSQNTLFAQFDGQYSQYMNNLCIITPAYVGEHDMTQVSIFQRTQWIGMKGAPITSLLSADMPFKIGDSQHGVGVQFLSDIFGVFNNQQMRFMYAYKHKLKKGHLSFGANIGLINIICNGDSINIDKIEYDADDHIHYKTDPAIPVGKQTGVGFDLGLGAQYFTDNFRVGLSVTHITKPQITLGDRAYYQIQPFMQIHGGYDFQTRNPDYRIRLNLLIASDFIAWTSHISACLDIKNKFWVGLGLRLPDAVSLMGGIEVLNGLKIGYTFDLATNVLISKTFGSHEVFATYEFSFVREKSKSLKSIRIL